jgi:hypothetical protein
MSRREQKKLCILNLLRGIQVLSYNTAMPNNQAQQPDCKMMEAVSWRPSPNAPTIIINWDFYLPLDCGLSPASISLNIDDPILSLAFSGFVYEASVACRIVRIGFGFGEILGYERIVSKSNAKKSYPFAAGPVGAVDGAALPPPLAPPLPPRLPMVPPLPPPRPPLGACGAGCAGFFSGGRAVPFRCITWTVP